MMGKRIRKRGVGPFPCSYTSCGKVFSRSDHLRRHMSSHDPTKRLRCRVSTCTKSFTRNDARKVHEKTHIDTPPAIDLLHDLENSTFREETSATQIEAVGQDDDGDDDVPNPHHDIDFSVEKIFFKRRNFFSPDISPSEGNSPFGITSLMSPENQKGVPPKTNSNIGPYFQTSISGFSPDLMGAFEESIDFDFEIPDIFKGPLPFSQNSKDANEQQIDQILLSQMVQYIPDLQEDSNFTLKNMKLFLSNYWSAYHPQFPVLHKPSFSTPDAHPLLLLSMALIGSSLCQSAPAPGYWDLIDSDTIVELSDKIARPLRWLLLSCPEAAPPCKSWLIHSLLILEMYEINRSTRDLHERACIYSATKIQLLRRSPFLGDQNAKSSLENWIENESMRRVAWEAFYVDTIQAVVFNHPANLYANNLKLSLPCPDEFWETDSSDALDLSPSSLIQIPTISESLRKILQNEHVSTGYFGYKIILAGLLNLILQMEQTESQSLVLGLKLSEDNNWQELIASALEYWKLSAPKTSNLCSDKLCQYPEYHAAQTYLRIRQYDYYVYAGSPHRANVKINMKDYESAAKRISRWAQSLNGALTVVQAYILLFEMIVPLNSNSNQQVMVEYEPQKDPVIYRPMAVLATIFPLWCYVFNLYGPESSFKAPDTGLQLEDGFTPSVEDPGSYLRRIREEFGVRTGKPVNSLSSMGSEMVTSTLAEYAKALPEIPKINNIVGLLVLLARGYSKSSSQVAKRFGTLIKHCSDRSMGSNSVFCVELNLM